MNIYLLLYLILCVLHISFRSEGMGWPTRISKVLLMPLLLVYYLTLNTDNNILTLLVVLALLLGTAGDAFMAVADREKSFYAGIFCFFVGHLAYISYFALHLQSWGYFLFIMLALAFPLYKVVISFLPSKGTFFLGGYALVLFFLIAFCASALSLIAMGGAIFFAISGYLIAMGVVEKHTFTKTTIMATYALAQLLLIVGILTLQGAF